MSRTRYIDFRAPDSTELLNNNMRVILEDGVYAGFNVGQGGSGGLWLKFTHDPDPDNTGDLLGKFVTRDGVIVMEDANQDDVVVGSLTAGTPNIHYVVASYVYNQALPNNDTVYAVRQGVSGAPPTPPTLTDDEVLLAIIDVPSGATDYSTSDIKTVGKKSIMGGDYDQFFPDVMPGVLDAGIYEGMEIIVGSTDLDVTLNAGVFMTQETQKIVEAADQVDLFTLTDPNAGNYALAWVVGMHKNEDTDPVPDVDYLLVEGSAVAIGNEASLPNDTAILAAAVATHFKYTDPSYINKLGYIRVENRAGTYHTEYVRGETILDDNSIVVYGAEARSLNRSGKYFGHQGLKQAIDDIYALTEADTEALNFEEPYTLLLDGRFKLSDAPLRIPSHIKLQGLGAPAIIESDYAGDIIRLQGFHAEYDGFNNTVTQVAGPTSPPAGYVSRTFEIQAAYRAGDDLVARLPTYGDTILAESGGVGTPYTGYVVQLITTSNNWTIEVFIETQYNTDGNQTDLHFTMLKRNSHLKDVEIRPINSGNGLLTAQFCEQCSWYGVKTQAIFYDLVRNSHIGFMEIAGTVFWNGSSITTMLAENNTYGHLKFTGTSSITLNESQFCNVGLIEYINTAVAVAFGMNMDTSNVGQIRITGNGSEVLTLSSTGANFNYVYCGNNVNISGQNNTIQGLKADQLEFNGQRDIVLWGDYTTFVDTAADPSNRVMFSSSATHFDEVAEMPHSDRNLKMVSLANIGWTLSSGLLEWDAPLKFDNPWTAGYSQVAIGDATLSADGDRLYIDLARDAVGVSVVGTSVRAKASAASDRYTKNRVFVAQRDQNVIYLWDGTRVEDGQTVKIGSTPPPDGSVTYSKLAYSAVEYWDHFMRNHVASVDVGSIWEPDVVFRNTDLATIAYTTGSGNLAYTGLTAGALDTVESLFNAGVPIYVIFRNTEHDPGVAGKGAYTFEEILGVQSSSDLLRIAQGLDVTEGAANIWNGAIAVGGKILTNDGKVTFTYDAQGANPGRVTYASGLGFSSFMARPGYIWKDSAGTKYQIIGADSSGNGDWIEIHPGLRDVNTSTPSTKHHGSIEMNVNPYDVAFEDKRTLLGAEFIPIDTFGQYDIRSGEQLVRPPVAAFNEYSEMDRRFPTPYDDRVRVWGRSAERDEDNDEPNDDASNKRWMYGHGAVEIVEYTGVCTGAMLVVAGGGSTLKPVTVDGYKYSNAFGLHAGTYDNIYGVEYNRYELLHCTQMIRLPQHVHHLQWDVGTSTPIRGILVFNTPSDQEDLDQQITESPGKFVIRGGVSVSEEAIARQATPTPVSGWMKGGHAVRYVDASGSHAWETTFVRNTIDQGDATGGINVTNVVSPTSWRVGDLVLMIDSITVPGSFTKYIRRIVTITGTTVVLNSALPGTFVKTGANMYYYGHVYQLPADDRNFGRSEEEIAAVLPIADFSTPGPIDDSYGTDGIHDSTRTVPIGSRLSDLTTAIAADVGFRSRVGGRIYVDSAGKTLRIWFVGTGLSIRRTASGNAAAATVDGVDIPPPGTTDSDEDPGGTFICGELPYGSHVVEIESPGAGEQEYSQITIWQSKKPSVPANALELLDVNLVASSEADEVWAGYNAIDSLSNNVNENQVGTINMPAIALVHPESNTAHQDTWYPFNNSYAIWSGWNNGGVGALATDAWYFPFYGNEITLRVNGLVLAAGGPLEVTFLDNDGQFKVPSTLTGFFPTSGSLAGDTIGATGRHRWKFGATRLHVLRVKLDDAGQTIAFDGVETHCPFHAHKTKAPVCTDHMMPYQFAGLDTRNMVPFDSSMVPLGQFEHTQGIWINSTETTIDNQVPFVFYTKGGPTEVSVSARLKDDSGGGFAWFMEIDGLDDGPPVYPNSDIPATGHVTTHATRILTLRPGFHYARLMSADTADSVKDCSWRCRFVVTARATQIQSRGLGVPGFGPATPNESSI